MLMRTAGQGRGGGGAGYCGKNHSPVGPLIGKDRAVVSAHSFTPAQGLRPPTKAASQARPMER